MAQNVKIANIEYSDVPAIDVPKTGGGTATFVDTSDATANATDVANGEVFYNSVGRSIGTGKYASAPVHNGNANRTNAILYGECDSTSTATAYTATVSGLTEYYDGATVLLKNGVVTSASGFTININGLGAKPSYSNMATGNPVTPTDPTRDTTIFNINYAMLFVYSSTIVEGGGWICYRGYDANTNTIGYQLRTNSQSLPMKSVTYRYRLLFTSADGKHYVPANNSTSTNATSSRTVCQDKIDPFGPIYYYGTTASVASGSRPSATYLWNQYTLSLGYSFNRTGSALTLTSWRPVYVKCAPQTDGSAIIDSTTPYVQELPSTDDGKIYIFLGVAYSATSIELLIQHPVYYFKDGQIRLYTNQVAGGGGSTVEVTPVLTSGTNIAGITVDGVTTQLYAPNELSAYNSNPAMDGTASAGSSDDYARGDHVHPSDTSKANAVHTHSVDDITDGHIWINLSSDPFLSIEWSTSSINWHHSSVCMDLYGNPNDGYTLGSAGMLQLSTIQSALSMGGNSVVPVLRIYSTTQSPMVDEIALITNVVFTSQTTGYIEALNITRDGVFHRYEIYLDITDPTVPVVTVTRNNITIPTVPTNVSAFTNDAGYLTSYTETDPTVPSWAKASTKPSYTANEVGALATTGGQITGNLSLYAPSGNSPAIIFQRGTLGDNYNDWKIYDKGGYLYFAQRGSTGSDFADMGYIDTSGVLRSFTIPWASVSGKPTIPADANDLYAQLQTTSGQWSNVQDALDGLERDKQDLLTAGTGIDISSSTIKVDYEDLDDVDLDTLQGSYVAYAKGNCTNMPTTYGGMVISRAENYGAQLFITYSSTDRGVYYRRKNNGTWSSWLRLNDAYVAGDSFGVSSQTCIGHITNSSKTLEFSVQLPRQINASTVTVNNLTMRVRASSGGYILQDVDVVGQSGYTISASANGVRTLYISIVKSSAFTVGSNTVTNNTPVAIELRSGTQFTLS